MFRLVKREFSLKGRKAFKEVFTRGKKIQGKGFQFFVLLLNKQEYDLNNTGKKIKIGIVLNRKFGNAVVRNRTRRRIRTILNELLSELITNFYLIVRPGNIVKNNSYHEIRVELYAMLKKSGLMQK